jgi:hypothetical protein
MIRNGVIVHRHFHPAAHQTWQQPGKLQQFGEASLQRIGSFGEITTQKIPEGLILRLGEEALACLIKRTGIRRCPDQNAAEHLSGTSCRAGERKDLLTSLSRLRKHFGSGHRDSRGDRVNL